MAVVRPVIAASLMFVVVCGGASGQPRSPTAGERALAAIIPPVVGQRACFVRKYDREHLLRHGKQQVTEMGFSLRYERIPGAGIDKYVFAMSARLRTRTELLYASGKCETNVGPGFPAGNLCGVDCDGGGVSIEKADTGDSIYVHLETPASGIAMG